MTGRQLRGQLGGVIAPGRCLRVSVVLALVLCGRGVSWAVLLPQPPAEKAPVASDRPARDGSVTADSVVDPAIMEARSHLRDNLPQAAAVAKKRLADPAPLTVPQRADLLWIAGSALSIMGQHDEALKWLEEGVELTTARPLMAIRRRLLRYVAASALETGHPERGAEAAREALQISTELGDHSAYVAFLHNELANNESRLGHVEEAIRHYRLGLEVAERNGNANQKAMILSNLAGVLGQLKRYHEAIELLNDVLEIAVKADKRPVLAAAYVSLGDNYFAIGNLESAGQSYQQAKLQSTDRGTRSFLAAAELGLGDVAVRQERIGDAENHYQEAHDIYASVKDPSGLLAVENRLRNLHPPVEQQHQMIQSLEESLKKAEAVGDSSLIQEACVRLALLYEQDEDFENAARVLRRSMDLQEEMWNRAHAEELVRTRQMLDREKIQRLNQEATVRQSDLERQRQRNVVLWSVLLVSGVMLAVFTIVLLDRRRAIHRLQTAEAEIRQQKQIQIVMERRLAEQQRTQSMGLMAAGIAHDFNNLLTAISGFAEIGTWNSDHDQKNESFRQITTVAFQAAGLTKQLRQFMAKPDEVSATCSLTGVVESMLPLLNSIARPSVNVEIHSETRDLWTGIDDAQLRQILINLTSNSIDALAGGNGRVVIRLSVRELSREDLDAMRGGEFAEPGWFSCMEVSDNGPGIPDEIRSRVFDPYFSTKSVGRGLGLASVLGIVRSCRGAVQVVSGEGHGTTIQVCIPQVEGTAPPNIPGPQIVPESLPPAQTPLRKTILLVDDEPLIRKSISDVLARAGYEIQTAEDAHSAMKMLPSIADQLSVAIVDYSMPGASGVWLAQRLHEHHPGLPVIICSGYAAETIPLDANVRAFMHKPYRASDLLREIRQCEELAARAG